MIGLWAGTAVIIRQQTDITPLHYTIYFGIDLSGPANRLWALPVFGTISWVSHLFIGQLHQAVAWVRSALIMNIMIEILLAAALLSLSLTLAGS